MTVARTLPVRSWLGLILSASLCAVAWGTAYHWRPFTLQQAGDLSALLAEREVLRGQEDAVCDALRTQVSKAPVPTWSEQALEKLPEQFGAGWQCDLRSEGASGRMQLVRLKPRLDEWPEYLAVIERWSRTPGVSLESVEILAEGGVHDRTLTRVAIALRFHREAASTRDASRAGPSPGPAPVAPAEIPAAPGSSGPSLRCAGQRPASASFRPDPPGSPAGA